MIVIGRKEKAPFEAILPDCTVGLQQIYSLTREANGQKWLMIDLEDHDDLYRDVFRTIEIRNG